MAAQPQAWQPFRNPRYGAIRVGIGRLMHWHFRHFVERRRRDHAIDYIAGVPILVVPGVLNPRLMRTGEFFARQLRTGLLSAQAEVLDMGTGSGVCAVFAARAGCRVVAVDINPQAARCARINVLMNRCEDRVEVLVGDLFGPLGGRRFDLVLFNPPFLQGTPRDDADRAWRSTDVPERFAAGLRDHLTASGSALLLLSSFADPELYIGPLRQCKFDMRVVTQRRFVNEQLTLLRLTPQAGAP
ncbi:MAG TPA: methyltransferase [Steroidobacteraceae bacterium]|jgi:release factor glutamine methyltransferase